MPRDGLRQLAHALDVLRRHRSSPQHSDQELLAEHPDLRELLAPLLAGSHDQPEAPTTSNETNVLGDYRLLRPLGRGGMGEVHEAVQRSLGRRVALKLLAADRARSPAALARFRREAELLATVRHEHVVAVHATGEASGRYFFAMELIDGATLAQVIDQLKAAGGNAANCDGTSLARALREVLGDSAAGTRLLARDHTAAVVSCLLPIAQALAHVHGLGIVHRDVKPANILLRRDGQPLLTDFGLARDGDAPGMTQTGDFAGTPHYVAPEQISGGSKDADERTDVFALAVTAYEALTLQRPFEAPTTEAVLQRVLHANPPDPRRSGAPLSPDLCAVLDKALQKDRAERYANMGAFAADLRAIADQRAVSVRTPSLWTRLRRYARREPLRAAFFAVLLLAVPTIVVLGLYVVVQQPRIAAAAARERDARVEELLEAGYLELGDGNALIALRRFAAARELDGARPEALVGLVLACDRLGHRDAMQRARSQLGASHPHLHAELLGLATDVSNSTPERAVVPQVPTTATDALGWYVRGMRWLGYAHHCGSVDAYRRAAEALRQCIDRTATARALYHCEYLHTLSHLKEAEPIRAFCDVVAQLWPDAPIATYWRGFAMQDIDNAAANALLQRVVDARDDLTLARCALARTYEHQQQWAEARRLYGEVLATEPEDAVALCGAARADVYLGKASTALPMADRACALYPGFAQAHQVRAGVLLELGRAEEGLAAVDRALAILANDPESHFLRSRLLTTLGRYDEAVAAAAAAEPLAPRSAEPFVIAHLAHVAAGDFQAARDAMRRVVALQPHRVEAWDNLGWHSMKLEDVDGAHDAFERCLELQPNSSAAHAAMGLWHKRYGEPVEAARYFERALALDATNHKARVNRASLRWTNGDREGSLADYRAAVAGAPELEPASDGLVWVCAQLGRHADLIAERRRWAELHPDSRVAWLKLCKACLDVAEAKTSSAPTETAAAEFELADHAVARAAQAAKDPRADVLFWRATVAHRRGAPAADIRALYVEARSAPGASPDLLATIDRRLAELQ